MLHLRAATLNDARAVASAHALSWRTSYRGQFSDVFLDGDVLAERTAAWTPRLRRPDPDQVGTLAELDGQVVGFSCTLLEDDACWGALLDNLHVQPHLKGQGVGSTLLSQVARICHERSPTSGLSLWVLDANGNARRFYERHGATCAGEEGSPPGGGRVRRLRYAWTPQELVRISMTTSPG
ncbi:GNAT family N-acetyltransferase [Deinococcus pimensis]|uniref:GNAT family N-acetyltransferase n=1 Tax=Deinococcus pimensis TaxID=309888 RepID=UPI000488A00F|nr:GNAT family N-acetyltransferase [Deinococcus pimensis]